MHKTTRITQCGKQELISLLLAINPTISWQDVAKLDMAHDTDSLYRLLLAACNNAATEIVRLRTCCKTANAKIEQLSQSDTLL